LVKTKPKLVAVTTSEEGTNGKTRFKLRDF